MSLISKTILVLVLLIGLIGAASACSISSSNLSTEVRGNTDYYSTISAGTNQDIDIRITFNVNTYTGTDCPANISAKAIIKRYNNDTGNWENYRTTTTKSQELSVDQYVFVWSNEFNTGTNSKYTEYEVEGQILSGSTILDSQEAYVEVENNSCSGINLVASDFTLNEGSSNTRTLRVENNTNTDFRITSLNVLFTSSLITSGSTDYDNIVAHRSTSPINLYLNTGFVSSDSRTTATFAVEGYLGNTFCSQTSIGRKTFVVTVQDTGANNYNYYYDDYYGTTYNSNSDCSNIELTSNTILMNESSNTKPVITLKNNSTKRFEILEVKTTQNGINLSTFYAEKYVFPGQVSDIILNATSPSVTNDTTYSNTIWVRGNFSNGLTCSFNNIRETTLTTTITNTTSTNTPFCGGLTITAPATINLQQGGLIPITINNNTNKRVDVFIEGSLETTPTIISLPDKTSISRNLVTIINAPTGVITLRPVIEGCTTPITTIQVNNTAINTSNQGQNTGENTNSGLSGLFTLGANGALLGLLFIAILIILVMAGIIVGKPKQPTPQDEAWKSK